MTLPVIFLTDAEADSEEAFDYYQQREAGLGEMFRLEIDRAVGLVQRWPESYQHLNTRLRRVVLRRFPYVIVYRLMEDHLRVVGIVATHRDLTFVEQRDPEDTKPQ